MSELKRIIPTTPVPGRCAVVPTGITIAPVLIIFTLPLPSGAILISPFNDDVILLPFTSKSPPSLGDLSSSKVITSSESVSSLPLESNLRDFILPVVESRSILIFLPSVSNSSIAAALIVFLTSLESLMSKLPSLSLESFVPPISTVLPER